MPKQRQRQPSTSTWGSLEDFVRGTASQALDVGEGLLDLPGRALGKVASEIPAPIREFGSAMAEGVGRALSYGPNLPESFDPAELQLHQDLEGSVMQNWRPPIEAPSEPAYEDLTGRATALGRRVGDIAMALGDPANIEGPAGVSRAAWFIGTPGTKRKVREVITSFNRLPKGSVGRDALARAITEGGVTLESGRAFVKGQEVGGAMGLGRVDEDFFAQQALTPRSTRYRMQFGRGGEKIVPHETGHLMVKGLPEDTIKTFGEGTRTGALPLHSKLKEKLHLYAKHYGKDKGWVSRTLNPKSAIPDYNLTNENIAFHMEDWASYSEMGPKARRFLERELRRPSRPGPRRRPSTSTTSAEALSPYTGPKGFEEQRYPVSVK